MHKAKFLKTIIATTPIAIVAATTIPLTSCTDKDSFLPNVVLEKHINVSVEGTKIKLNQSFTINYTLEAKYEIDKIKITVDDKELTSLDYELQSNKIIVKGEKVTSKNVKIDITTKPIETGVDSIIIKQQAYHKTFHLGDPFDHIGLILTVRYSDGTSIETDKDFTTNFDGKIFTDADYGENTVEVTFGGKTVKYNIAIQYFVTTGGPIVGHVDSPTGDPAYLEASFNNYAPGEEPYIEISINGEEFKHIKPGTKGEQPKPIELPADSVFILRGDNPYGLARHDGVEYTNLKFTAQYIETNVSLGGSVTGLLNNGRDEVTIIPEDTTFYRLFKGSTCLQTVAKNFLPSTLLTEGCYEEMFAECDALRNLPNLPASQLVKDCYKRMFYKCTAVVTPMSELPALELGESCYEGMFHLCRRMTSTPEIKAITLAKACCKEMYYQCDVLKTTQASLSALKGEEQCYSKMYDCCYLLEEAPEIGLTSVAKDCCEQMFISCKSLTKIPKILPALDLTGGQNCYTSMFRACDLITETPILPATKLAPSCYDDMFGECKNLKKLNKGDGQQYFLPALDLTDCDGCYGNMFSSCPLLQDPPELPATKLAPNCYNYMFAECELITQAPALPASDIERSCYCGMFRNCTKLTTAPALNATTIKEHCYMEMFKGCKSLTTAPALPAKQLTQNAYREMFAGCTSLTTLTLASGETSYIPTGTKLAKWSCSSMFSGCKLLKIAEGTCPAGSVPIFTYPADETAEDPCSSMFSETGGSFTGTPTKGNSYYQDKQ